jgi:hypothetical protein
MARSSFKLRVSKREAQQKGLAVPSNDQALEQAKDIIAKFGICAPDNMPRIIVASGTPWKFEKLALGLHPRGRRVAPKAGSDSAPSGGGSGYRDAYREPYSLGRSPARLKPGAQQIPPTKLLGLDAPPKPLSESAFVLARRARSARDEGARTASAPTSSGWPRASSTSSSEAIAAPRLRLPGG